MRLEDFKNKGCRFFYSNLSGAVYITTGNTVTHQITHRGIFKLLGHTGINVFSSSYKGHYKEITLEEVFCEML